MGIFSNIFLRSGAGGTKAPEAVLEKPAPEMPVGIGEGQNLSEPKKSGTVQKATFGAG